jgi:HAE1 family hydrophobic/amphiphilic exporter-1
MLILGAVLLGGLSLARLPVDLLPAVAYPRIVVQTSFPGAAPAEVERLVTEPLEQAVSSVHGVRQVESVTREGVSLVIVRFAWGTDMDFAALGVRERLDNARAALPARSGRPAVLRADPRSEPIMAISLAGGRDLGALRELADAVFRRRLEQIDGLAQATVAGGAEREIRVEVDPRLLETYGVNADDIVAALEANNANAPGGTVLRGGYRYTVRAIGELASAEEIGAVPVRQRRTGGGPTDSPVGTLRVRDVARVVDDFAERESLTRLNGRESVSMLIFKNAEANTVRVAGRVEDVMAELRREYPGVKLEVAMNQAGFIRGALANVAQEVLLGGILAFLVLFLFLREWRYPVAVGLAIPVSLMTAFALMPLAGVTINVLSLGGLALGVGMLMDNSIVVLENIFRHRELGLGARLAAITGAAEVQRAIVASTLTTIAVFGPIVYVEGIAGQLLGALAWSVSFSLMASIVVAITLLPALAARWDVSDGSRLPHRATFGRLLSAPLDYFERGWARFTLVYERALEVGLRYRGFTVACAAVLLVIGLAMGASLPRSILPDVDQGTFRVRVDLPRGTPLEVADSIARRLDVELRADPAVARVFAQVGRRSAVTGLEVEESGTHSAMLDVELRDGERTAAALQRLERHLSSYPPGSVVVESGQATSVGRLLGGGDAAISIRVRGNDASAAMRYATEVTERIRHLPVLSGVRTNTQGGHPEVRIEVDRERASEYGVSPDRIAATLEGYMRGRVATELVEFDRVTPVIVRLAEAERRSASALDEVRVDGVPLRTLVRIDTATGPAEIRRVDQGRVVTVEADVARGGIEGASSAVHDAIRSLSLPEGLQLSVGGESEAMQRGFRGLMLALGLSVLLVYMLLAAEFESLLHPFVVLLAVPLAAIGATVALWATGGGINTMSLIGMVILVGIVDNDAVVKIDFINRLRREGLGRHEAIRAAGHARLRPIVMNSLTASLGLLPMAVGVGSGAELQAPLATAVLGGLVSATLLTLVVVPVCYDLLEDVADHVRTRRAGSGGAGRECVHATTPEPEWASVD